MANTVKLLVAGYESSGKSTITSKVENALVINFDKKEYGFSVPHANFKKYEGIDSVIDFINEKISSYKEKFGKFPDFIILDTITQLYAAMTKYNSIKYSGFKIHEQNNIDTLELNNYIENVLIANGVSVIVVAHTVVDPDSGRHIIPAQGQFAKAGSWLSIVNDAIFIEKSSGKLIVYFKSFKYPARSTLKELPEKVDMDKFDINEYIRQLLASKTEAEEYVL